MSSWITCVCGNRVHANLFAGANASLLLAEQHLDQSRHGLSAEQFASFVVANSDILVTCTACGRIAVQRRSGEVEFLERLRDDHSE